MFLSKLIIGSTRGFIRGQILATTADLNGKANTNHTHDDRYYTEAEVNNLIAQSGGFKTYFLKDHWTTGWTSRTYNVGFTIAIVFYRLAVGGISYGFGRPGETIRARSGNRTCALIQVTATSLVVTVQDEAAVSNVNNFVALGY